MLHSYLSNKSISCYINRTLTSLLEVLPEELKLAENFAEQRKKEFFTGRFCARQALKKYGLEKYLIAFNENGAPQWPAGYVGAITHTEGFYAAAVSPTSLFKGIGIDAVSTRELETRQGFKGLILLEREQELIANALLGPAKEKFAHLIFSMKESVFKCLLPNFDFDFDKDTLPFNDISIVAIEEEESLLTIEFADALVAKARFLRKLHTGKYFINAAGVQTCFLLSSESN
ncbi:MAG: 4'-phosphopantetheinyl transferase superfamily protein [Pseudomonadota bacterium]